MTAPQIVTGWPLELWLASADRIRRDSIVIVWDAHPDQTAILPCGIKWDAIKTPTSAGLAALQGLLNSPNRAAIGPVLRDHRTGALYWLTPIETASEPLPPDAHRLGRGHHIAAPAPNRGVTRPAEWIHLGEAAGILTPAHLLAAALQAAAEERNSA